MMVCPNHKKEHAVYKEYNIINHMIINQIYNSQRSIIDKWDRESHEECLY